MALHVHNNETSPPTTGLSVPTSLISRGAMGLWLEAGQLCGVSSYVISLRCGLALKQGQRCDINTDLEQGNREL
jgi:hypothetical protein